MGRTTHEVHAELSRLQLLDTGTLAYTAYSGAEHHLAAIKQLLGDDSTPEHELTSTNYTNPFDDQAKVNEFHWRLRAFFWEMVGAFDLLLQWANECFQLGLPEEEVTWKNMPTRASKDQAGWDKVRGILQETWDSTWYFEIRTYRNFAHRSFLQVQALVPQKGKAQIFLPHARKYQPYYEDVRVQLAEYLEKIRQLGNQLFQSKQ